MPGPSPRPPRTRQPPTLALSEDILNALAADGWEAVNVASGTGLGMVVLTRRPEEAGKPACERIP